MQPTRSQRWWRPGRYAIGAGWLRSIPGGKAAPRFSDRLQHQGGSVAPRAPLRCGLDLPALFGFADVGLGGLDLVELGEYPNWLRGNDSGARTAGGEGRHVRGAPLALPRQGMGQSAGNRAVECST